MYQIQLLAGAFSSLIFISATFPMLYKAWQTKNMASYSLVTIILNNVGNLSYWLYITTLPFGPVWLVHGFNTAATLLMLLWFLLYRHQPEIAKRITTELKRQTLNMPIIKSVHKTTQEIPTI